MRLINKDHYPLIIIFLVIVLLLILSYSPIEYNYGPFKIKRIDILSQIRENKKVINSKKILSNNIQATRPKNNIPTIDAKNLHQIEDFGNGSNFSLTNFFSKLNDECQYAKIHVAFFGDSLIEGDLVSEEFRDNLQNKFGGRGVGFVPITSEVARFRTTIRHSYSNNWHTISSLNKNDYNMPVGMSGYLFIPKTVEKQYDQSSNEIGQYSWVEYSAPDHNEKLNSFKIIRLLYGAVQSDAQITYSFDNSEYITKPLLQGKGIKEFIIKKDTIRKVKLIFSSLDDIVVYGACFEDGPGIYVDNFSMRGSSGINLGQIPDSIYQGFHNLLNYKLIILQYGANIANPDISSYLWYENKMFSVLSRLKTQFPDTSILVVSAADKSIKSNMEYTTNPAIPMIVNAQRNAAKRARVAFWNLYEAMGGENSMSMWTEQGLGAGDYTHLNHSGAKKVANLLTKAILHEFNNYQKNTEK
jgi:lysophospholipase L1-like esterase